VFERFEVFMVVTVKNVIVWDVMPCGSCKSRRFGGTYCFHHQGDKNHPSSPILVTLMMEAVRSSEMSSLTRATWCNIPEDGILYEVFEVA
jgi:hypothetical protein